MFTNDIEYSSIEYYYTIICFFIIVCIKINIYIVKNSCIKPNILLYYIVII